MNHVCSKFVVFLFIVYLGMTLHVGSSFFIFGMSVSFGFVGVRGAFSFEFQSNLLLACEKRTIAEAKQSDSFFLYL